MHRLFVAIEVPDNHREIIRSICCGLPNARWIPPEQIHLTLRFIGEVDGVLFRDIGAALAEVQGNPFHLKVKGLGHFPPRREPKVLWLGITPHDQLQILRKRIESALMKIGLKPEGRKFSPHITIARCKNPPPPNRLADYLVAHSMFETPLFEVDSIHLFSSHLTSKGADHQIEYSYRLSP